MGGEWVCFILAESAPNVRRWAPVKRFDMGGGRQIDRFGSVGVSLQGISRRVLQVVVMRIEPGGRIGRHPAAALQLFAVSSGSGWVSGDDGERISIVAGEAVVWDLGEEHESGSDEGMTALVVEAEGLDA